MNACTTSPRTEHPRGWGEAFPAHVTIQLSNLLRWTRRWGFYYYYIRATASENPTKSLFSCYIKYRSCISSPSSHTPIPVPSTCPSHPPTCVFLSLCLTVKSSVKTCSYRRTTKHTGSPTLLQRFPSGSCLCECEETYVAVFISLRFFLFSYFPICSTTKRIFLGWVKEVRTTKS
jgi:hypothetical protein